MSLIPSGFNPSHHMPHGEADILIPLGMVYSAGSDPEHPLTLADFVLLIDPEGRWYLHELDSNTLTRLATNYCDWICQGLWYCWSVMGYVRDRATAQLLLTPTPTFQNQSSDQPSTSGQESPLGSVLDLQALPETARWKMVGPIGGKRHCGIKYIPAGFGGPYKRLFTPPREGEVTCDVAPGVVELLEKMWDVPPGENWCMIMEAFAAQHEGVAFVLPTVKHGKMRFTFQDPQRLVKHSPDTLAKIKTHLSYPNPRFGKWMPVARGIITLGLTPPARRDGVVAWLIMSEIGTIIGAWELSGTVTAVATSVADLVDMGVGELLFQRTFQPPEHFDHLPDTACANPFCKFHGISAMDTDSEDDDDDDNRPPKNVWVPPREGEEESDEEEETHPLEEPADNEDTDKDPRSETEGEDHEEEHVDVEREDSTPGEAESVQPSESEAEAPRHVVLLS
ncbi:hypothetical protein MRV_0131 [Murine roseolovirus]|uniref:Uncharacterized protein n=1 Tax=Murid betaherpesvirus 3 TaxID=2560603 RepID=A0A1P8VIN8_9BETA|nr:hypothetical protein MRV_0003 [Murine roseolovirus]YP_009344958.1 hypothetical protein MRV_0131 [Murine roseolovirus]APZ76214.1 hypothetical protein MRV_0003 [Murid betaherpesvirus 3]APZ76342.1 hypothetical protein MRV_0131 [Murid betaherpesvirus 3]